MWNCNRGNILSRNIWLKLVAPKNLVSSLGILLYRSQPQNWEMAQIASDLENNHTGRKLPTLEIRLGFLIENFSYHEELKPTQEFSAGRLLTIRQQRLKT